jgi:hypothetical protein
MPAQWPPPIDLESIQQLVREADPEGYLADGAPADEYAPEEEELFAAIHGFSTASLTAITLQPIVEAIWRKSFNLNDSELAKRSPVLTSLTQQIERFFGPQATPQVRGA